MDELRHKKEDFSELLEGALRVSVSLDIKRVVNDGYHHYMRRCQIRVQFESGARTKFLATLFQPMTSMSDYQSVELKMHLR